MTETHERARRDGEFPDVALGVKVFKRVEKARTLLDSVPTDLVSRVIVADDGAMTDRKEQLYATDFEFDLDVIDLEYDAGVGYGRKRIVDELAEEFLVTADPDHVCPSNLDVLVSQVEADDSLGGVAGSTIEPQTDTVAIKGSDLAEIGRRVIQDGNVSKRVESVAGELFIEFDFVPQSAVFRRECVEEYAWDPAYTTGGEHLDFFVGHWKRTDWRFGVCPNVCFQHFPGGSDEYITEHRNTDKLLSAYEHFGTKWGYDLLERGQHFCGLKFSDPVFAELGLVDDGGRLADDVTVKFVHDEENDELRLHVDSSQGNVITGKRDLVSDGLNRQVKPLGGVTPSEIG